MTANVKKIAEMVAALTELELDEFLNWLLNYEADRIGRLNEKTSGTNS